MTTTYFNTPVGALPAPAHLLSSQPVSRAPKAPWIETGFVQIPSEFFAQAIRRLSKGAFRVYSLHCKHARTRGERAGYSYCYRETLARELDCSLATIDRANAELERYGLIQDTGRRFQHGGAVMFQLQPPSQWRFDSDKTASSKAQKRAVGGAKMRPITKDKEHLKPKKQQPHAREVKPLLGTKAATEKVVVVEGNAVEELPVEVPPVFTALQAQGIEAQVALHWLAHHGEAACLYQLERLGRQKNVRNRVGWLRCALLRGDKDQEPAPPQAPAAPGKELSPEERARRRERQRQQEEQETLVAEQVFASLEPMRQAFVLRCIELEKTTLSRVIERDENYAFTLHLRRTMQ